MARLVKQIQLEDRGTLKTFEIKEMSAFAMEDFGARLALLILNTGVLSTVDVDALSTADVLPLIATVLKKTNGLQSLGNVDPIKLRDMRLELLNTVSIVTPGGAKLPLTQATIEGNIDDFKLLYKLEAEALKLNLNFSLGGADKTSESPAATSPSRPVKPKISAR